MTQVDPETFTGLMQWLRDRGKSVLALPLRRKGFGSLSALLAASEPELRDAGCPDDLVAMLLAMKPTRAGSAAPAVGSTAKPDVLGRVTHADGTGGRCGAAAGDDDDEIVDVFEQGAVVTLADLCGSPELNGKAGVVVGFEASKQRWIVDLGPELGKKLFRCANLVPSTKAAVRLDALYAHASAKATSAASPSPLASASAWVRAAAGAPGAGARDALAGTSAEGSAGELEVAPDGVQNRAPPPPGAALEHWKVLRPGAQVVVQFEGDPRYGEVGVCEICDFASGLWRLRFADGGDAALPPSELAERAPTLRPGAHVRVQGLAELNGRFGVCDALDDMRGRWSVLLESGEWKSLREENLKPQDGSSRRSREAELAAQQNPRESRFLGAMEDALASGEISWLDC
mmetsp:Transcript_99541/g.252949  ORF Transcript_99541/g.252949 Transcript_99541/m.252949 type:complete len:402 (+) Transcript_99541:108-1313(+)